MSRGTRGGRCRAGGECCDDHHDKKQQRVPCSPTGLLVANPERRGLASSFSAHYTYTPVSYPDTAVASPACFATEWDGVATAAARFATEGASFATSQGRVATKPG